MFYEEKLINGIMYCRTIPNGAWSQMSIERLSQKYADLTVQYRESRVEYLESMEQGSRLLREALDLI